MLGTQKRHRGDQFLSVYSGKIDKESVIKVVADQSSRLGTDISYLILTETSFLIKTTTQLDFRGEHDYKINGLIPTINLIRGKDAGLFKEIEKLKKKSHTILVDTYGRKTPEVFKDEDNGHLFYRIKTDPKFDPLVSTKFGRGFRRVKPLIRSGKIIGYSFIPFNEYPPQWASDIYGYDSFDDVLVDVFPYMNREIKHLKDLYLSRPKHSIDSQMNLTSWQQYLESILDLPVKYSEQERSFHWFADFIGLVGKSMLVRHILATRDDTIVLSSSGKMSDLICSIKDIIVSSSKIKNIIIDIPREPIDEKYSDVDFHIFDDSKNNGDTLKFMESCVNGRFTSLKYESLNIELEHGLKVIVLSNSLPLLTASSLDRWHINIIKNQEELCIKDLIYDKSLPRITSRSEVIDWYLSQKELRDYLEDNGMSSSRKNKQLKFHKID